jgi:hypothetical protein
LLSTASVLISPLPEEMMQPAVLIVMLAPLDEFVCMKLQEAVGLLLDSHQQPSQCQLCGTCVHTCLQDHVWLYLVDDVRYRQEVKGLLHGRNAQPALLEEHLTRLQQQQQQQQQPCMAPIE